MNQICFRKLQFLGWNKFHTNILSRDLTDSTAFKVGRLELGCDTVNGYSIDSFLPAN
jgi:hypothetical protein